MSINTNELMSEFRSLRPTHLCSLMTKYGSDKATKHNYSKLYHLLFDDLRDRVATVFELGIGSVNPKQPSNMGRSGSPGGSLRVWRDYFINALILAADIDIKTLFHEPPIHAFYCDQTSPRSVQALWTEIIDFYGGIVALDIMIEDGLHTFEANTCFFENSFYMVAPGGYYIEDLTSQTANKLREKIETDYRQRFPQFEFHVFDLPGTRAKDNRLFVAKHKYF